MKILLYFAIFTSKVIENALATLRLIVVSNGKRTLGAILNFITSIIWVITAGIVIINIQSDIFKVIFFCLGSGVGSYVGSYLESKIALGNNLIMCIIDKETLEIVDTLRNKGYAVTTIPGYGKDNEKYILMIFTPRKKRNQVVKDIKTLTANCMIISESAIPLYGGYTNL